MAVKLINRRLLLWALVLFFSLALGVARLLPALALSFTGRQSRIGRGFPNVIGALVSLNNHGKVSRIALDRT